MNVFVIYPVMLQVIIPYNLILLRVDRIVDLFSLTVVINDDMSLQSRKIYTKQLPIISRRERRNIVPKIYRRFLYLLFTLMLCDFLSFRKARACAFTDVAR